MRAFEVSLKVCAAAAALSLCLLSPAPASQEKRPPVRHDAARLRRALAGALGGEFEIVRDELTRRSTYHGGSAYWLAHVRPKRAGHFSLKYAYRYEDPVNKGAPLYTHVERTIPIPVGPRGCWRRPQYMASYYLPCLGDTVILPVLLDAYRSTYTGHTFVFTVNSLDETAGSVKGPEPWELSLRPEEDAGLRADEVPNPLAEHLKYLGSRTDVMLHRALGHTAVTYATFEAVRPGRFNLSVGARLPGVAPAAHARDASVPVIVVERGTPVTWLAAREDVRGYSGRFGSTWGENRLTTPVIMQPGERLTLPYHRYSVRGRDPEPEPRRPAEPAPFIRRLPFHVERDDGFNEWIVDRLPK